LTESVFTIQDVSVVEFLGLDNQNIKELALAFPKSKVVSRGNEIRLLGEPDELERIQAILASLLNHFQKNGKIDKETVRHFTEQDKYFYAQKELYKVENNEVLLVGSKGNPIKIKTENQRAMAEAIAKYDLVFAIGPAGTGKTYTAVALAVKALKEKQVKKIILTRPAVEAGENLGFLPGDLKEKLDPYLRPIYDALQDMIPADKLKQYQESNVIEIAPLAYMRGRTLNNAFIILDEAQNASHLQIKMFLTRMGPSSKVIITGDKTQIDLPGKQKSGLLHSLQLLKNVKGIGFVELNHNDVMRHSLVKDILEAYEQYETKNKIFD
jgi:phosphate starvation-inducible PhoH-like protein